MRLTRLDGPRRLAIGSALATLVAGLLLVAAPAPAAACSCVQQSIEEAADKADVVISGTVTGSSRRDSSGGRPNRDRVSLAVDVDRVYKGTITRASVQVMTPSDPATCGLGPVPPDTRYVIFASAQGSALSTSLCSGTRKSSTGFAERLRSALGEGTAVGGSPSSPTSAPPEKTAVDDSAPPELARVAAPGGALAIVGLLGLLVVRRRARHG